jgi:hypothetical protein
MKLTKAQFLTLFDVSREAAAVVFGGMVVGGFLTRQVTWIFSVIAIGAYITCVFLAVYFKKRGE